ncbi:RagB/SusD family nutrient uptake outer membrane protein [Pedobacter gandavensis]|uniref:RagB/SusD family nutrient uptake outer membrane protein n=1 Tax=Pedobacter gandavensis TaxID=2679963 RepID=UPI00292F3DC1|nr:RagB/SusD family nutrient uptake outer membrane protein [Pedobacter gandavensis]
MNNVKYLLLVAAMLFVMPGCKKFLNVTPIDAQSGNNFWKTKQDVEGFTIGIYTRLKGKIGGGAFMPALEMRGNFVTGTAGADYNNLIANNLKLVGGTAFSNIQDWKTWYEVIANSNIMYEEIDRVPGTALSDIDRKRYKAEAVFLRNLSYLFICRLFGDAIYYTDAYHSTSLPRTAQLTVLKNCIADMTAAKDDLPIVNVDGSHVGLRPTRGSAIALLMHLNMWAAAWDKTDKKSYYTSVVDLARELATYTNYKLLPVTIENTKKIFKGRSPENLFGILQEFNYGETFNQAAGYSYFFSHYPYFGSTSTATSRMNYKKDYLTKVFPVGMPDARLTVWFENYDADNNTFQFKKFINNYATGSGSGVTINSDDSAIIFRLPDMILLAAQAAAELDNDEEAKEFANQVRLMAGAAVFTSTGDELKTDLYFERCRELIGEGQFFFDAVRTKRILDSKYSSNPISVTDFNAGAWTWPLAISSTERLANPYLVGNSFWNK